MAKLQEKRYGISINRYRSNQYGAADFYIGSANTIKEAEEIIRKSRGNKGEDTFRIYKHGKESFKSSATVRQGKVAILRRR